MENTLDRVTYETLAPPHAYLPFRRAVVLGAGTMGAQIAAHLANAGMVVDLLDIPGEDEGDKNAVVKSGFARMRKTKPDPFFTSDTAERIRLGNFEEDFDRLADAEWILEAVVERLDVKRSLMERIEAAANDDAIISTNTSGLSIAEIASGRSDAFRRRFLGTHFFNPPRYLKLLEIIPSDATDPHVVSRMAHFGRLHLGKGVVVARDTPYFIGNRIGIYGMMQAMREFTDGDYSIEEIDALTGPLVGRPKSATFRTADVVGLDVMLHVADNLHEAVPDDESRGAFRPPELLRRLVDAGRLGQKSGQGFYKKEGKEIKSVDPESLEYGSPDELKLPELGTIERAGGLADRLRAILEADGRAGEFFRRTTLDLLGYSARRVPDITHTPADIDRAMRWGFGWEVGPFEIWDALGFDRVADAMVERGVAVPTWVETMRTSRVGSFYRQEAGRRSVYVPEEEGFEEDPIPPDRVDLHVVKSDSTREIWATDACGLLDIGDRVALFEFRSKANTLGSAVIDGLAEALDRVEQDRGLRGLVIGNEGKNFSVGADLTELATALQSGAYDETDAYLRNFQKTIQRVRYARKPVVVAVHQRVLGGGCEMLMACPHPVLAAESYVGLVELGVGLIPAATGTSRLAILAATRTANEHPSEVQAWLRRFFETVAMSTVATSAREAQEMGFVPGHARTVMHEDRRIHVAREEVIRLSDGGYFPPAPETSILVLGRPGRAAFEVVVQQYLEGQFITEYDAHLANRLAYVMTGGDLSAPQKVHEDYLIDLEREVFLELVRQPKTQARVEHMLKTKKPLRN